MTDYKHHRHHVADSRDARTRDDQPTIPAKRPEVAKDKADRRRLIAERAPLVRRAMNAWRAHYASLQARKMAGEVPFAGTYDDEMPEGLTVSEKRSRRSAYERRCG